jgi:predicted GH43/DUF377 family glycosyl hydrolase/tetratricopeptide (TPR) repeat protein
LLASGQTIGLCMIVRDEAEVIERCLASVLPLIDAWTICDTGSTDSTPALVEGALAGVPGTLHHRPWRDFGANRTELMELAAGSADYLLLIDADMTVEQRGELEQLSADVYLLRHLGSLDYAVPRLVRGDRRYWFEGATHEYLAGEGEIRREDLPQLVINHHADGGSRATKVERDTGLLEAALARDPDDARSTFYLAQTCADAGHHERAIELYRRRVELGGWEEEVFYAAFRAGQIQARSDPDRAVALLREAVELRPTRAEAHLELARIARLRRRYEEAYEIASAGLSIPYPEDLLFVHRDVYEWGLRFERSVAAYWTGRHLEALEDCDRLLDDGRLPWDFEAAAQSNRSYALGALAPQERSRRARAGAAERLDRLAPGARFGEVRVEVEPDWPAFNPSIAADGEGFAMIVRTANYRIVGGRYEFLDGGDRIQTLNYLARLGPDLGLRSLAPLEDSPTVEPARHPSAIVGYEDCRLICVDGRWLALATTRDRNRAGVCQIALLELSGERIERVRVLSGPEVGRHEKNWMPFVDADGLAVVYLCGPTVTYRCDVDRGELSGRRRSEAPWWAARMRGGSQGVPLGEGHLFVIHEVMAGDGGRIYLHRFVYIDRAGALTAASRRFSLSGERIELCAGMATMGEDLVLSFGVGDSRAALAVLAAEEALSLLEPVDPGAGIAV